MARKGNGINTVRDSVVREYLEEVRVECGWARRSTEIAVEAFQRLERYRDILYPVKNMLDLNHQDMEAMVSAFLRDDMSQTTGKDTLGFHGRFFKWAINKGYAKEDDYPYYKKVDTSFLRKPAVITLLSPHSVMLARATNRKARMRDIALFEMLLCTGLRRSELVQVRPCDIKWGDVPYDVELKAKSPYVKGTITLDPTRRATKTNLRRKVYISNFAAEILLKWMRIHNMPLDANYPIFPFDSRVCELAVYNVCRPDELKLPVIYPEREVIPGQRGDGVELGQEFGALDVDARTVENSFIASKIEKLQETERRKRAESGLRKLIPKNELDGEASKNRIVRDCITPHSLRYMYICLMYYRDFGGTRGNKDYISASSGHSIYDGSVIDKYLTNHALASSDNEWRNLWNGKASHWSLQRFSGDEHVDINKGGRPVGYSQSQANAAKRAVAVAESEDFSVDEELLRELENE